MTKESDIKKEMARPTLVKASEIREVSDADADRLSPAQKKMLLAIRSALLMAADAIGNYLGVKKRLPKG